jgi:hypothetical protein
MTKANRSNFRLLWRGATVLAVSCGCLNNPSSFALEPGSAKSAGTGKNTAATFVVPGKPGVDESVFDLAGRASTKMCHKPVRAGDCTFFPQVGKCWNVNAYEIRRGSRILHKEKVSNTNANNTYYSLITPLRPSRKTASLADTSWYKYKLSLRVPVVVYRPGYSLCGSGGPELGVTYADCGAKCLYHYVFYSLNGSARKILEIDGGNYSFDFVDLDLDGSIEAVGHDDTFQYWHASGADSAAPEIVLTLKPGKPVLNKKFMAAPAPDSAKMSRLLAETKARLKPPTPQEMGGEGPNREWIRINPVLFQNMLSLIYAGNARSAWSYLDQVWPQETCCYEDELDAKPVTKAQFTEDFKKQLCKSPYWQELKLLNNSDPCLNR